MNTYGQNIKITLFGESHGEYLGITIDGLGSGIQINHQIIKDALTKRRPKSIYSTSRSEADEYNIISGVYEGKTTGAPLTFLISNQNTISSDYSTLKNTPRPSHADYPAHIRYDGFNDPRGGGIFSGRITALIVIIGALAKQILNEKGIYIGSHIKSLHNIEDESFDSIDINKSLIQNLEKEDFPLINKQVEISMKEEILKAKETENSVGGIVESAIINLPAGVGDPLFLSIESQLSSLLFSIPSIKGVEFGDGFKISSLTGSEANDSYYYVNNKIQTRTNHNGGILGGLSTGMPIIIRAAVKPTPSIGIRQSTVDLSLKQDTFLEIKGRHDPAIVNRVVHVINSALYFGVLDILSSPILKGKE
ncbi:MAG: chorismate synthase [Firmicutes bacterium]|nr:chorismate synthase [Bacillota bacterium]